MLYAICRTSKVKWTVAASGFSKERTSAQSLYDAEAHELRLKEVLNADPSRYHLNRLIIDGLDLTFPEASARGLLKQGLFQERLWSAAGAKGIVPNAIPQDVVLLQEVMLTASPDFFSRQQEGNGLEVLLDEKYHAWRATSVKFLNDRFKGRIVLIVEHLDEGTPHLAAFVAPLVEKADKPRGRWGVGKAPLPPRWRFAAADLFGRRQLSELWTEYAAATKGLGLVRPPKAAHVTYETIGKVYAAIAASVERVDSDGLVAALELPPPRQGLIPETATNYVTRVSPDLQRAKAEIAQTLKNLCLETSDGHRNRSRVRELRRKIKEDEEARKKLQDQLLQQQRVQENLNTLFRDVFCNDLFKALGISAEAKGSEVHARTGSGYAIVVRGENVQVTTPTGVVHKGTGSIELLQHLFGTTVQQAEQLCIELVGRAAIGAINSRLLRTLDGRQQNPTIAKAFADHLRSKTGLIPKLAVEQPADFRNHLKGMPRPHLEEGRG